MSELNLIKRDICSLYKKILKAHYKFIKIEEMRVFGDYFVKSEFTLNYHNTTDINQLKQFVEKWIKYYDDVVKFEIKPDLTVKNKLDLEHIKTLNEIKELVSGKIHKH